MLQHVSYVTAQYHVVELYSPIGSEAWAYVDLTEIAGAPQAPGGLTSWVDPIYQHVISVDSKANAYELYSPIDGGAWAYNTLVLSGTAIPWPFDGVLTSWADPNYQHVVYVAAASMSTGSVQMQFSPIGSHAWAHTDLSGATGAPPMNLRGGLASWADANSQHVVYIDTNGNVQELYFPTGAVAWVHNNLTAAAMGAPQAIGVASGWSDGKYQYVIYQAADNGHIHQLYSPIGGGAWADSDLIAATDALPPFTRDAENPFGGLTSWADPNSQHVIYMDSLGGVQELFSPTGSGAWANNNLTIVTGAPFADPYSFLTSWWDPSYQHVIYKSQPSGGNESDEHLHELFSPTGGGAWAHNDLTIATGAPPAGRFNNDLTSWTSPAPASIGNLSVAIKPQPVLGTQQSYVFSITNAADGTPVPGAVVTLNNGPEGAVGQQTSDANGQAEFTGVTLMDIMKFG